MRLTDLTSRQHPAQGDRAIDVWILGLTLLAVATAASAYLGVGVFASTDAPMLFTASTVGVAAIAWLHSSRPLVMGRAGLTLALSAVAVVTASTLLSEFTPFALFGSPRSRLGVLTLVPVALLLLFARPFAREIANALRRIAPWVFAAWALAMAWQGLRDLPMVWGLSSNGAISAQVMLMFMPVLLFSIEDRRLRFGAGAAVVALLWLVESRLGVVLGVAWLVVDTLNAAGVFRTVSRRSLRALPVIHLAMAAAVIGAVVYAGIEHPAAGIRPEMWRGALDLVVESPVAGWGPDSYSHVAPMVMTVESAYVEGLSPTLSISAHNVWLDVLVQFGVSGGVILLASGILLVRQWPVDTRSVRFPFAVGLWLYSLTVIFQPVALQTLPLLSLMIIATLPRTPPGEPPPLSTREVRIARVAAFTAVSFAAILALFASTCVVVGRPEYRPAGVTTVEGAARIWRYEPELWAQTAYRYGMRISGSGDPAATIGEMETSLGRAIRLVPGEWRYRYELAYASDLLGLDEALVERRYDAALSAHPLSPEVNLAQGLFLVRQGDLEEARRAYEVLAFVYPDWRETEALAAALEDAGISLQ